MLGTALSITFTLLIITIGISYLIAFIIKGMTIYLERMSKKKRSAKEAEVNGVVESDDESDIAAVIAIAHSQCK